jgi:hypothetical protein
VWLIDNVLSPALKLPNSEMHTQECINRRIINFLKSGVNFLGQTSFLQEKSDSRSLPNLAHLTRNDVINESHTDKVGGEGHQKGNKEHKDFWNTLSLIHSRRHVFFGNIG